VWIVCCGAVVDIATALPCMLPDGTVLSEARGVLHVTDWTWGSAPAAVVFCRYPKVSPNLPITMLVFGAVLQHRSVASCQAQLRVTVSAGVAQLASYSVRCLPQIVTV
jgi:hypothetical protein